MKKVLLLFIGVLSMSVIQAQNISDVLRFSSENVQGTARYRAMSGAFGALGGDLSGMSNNPAGSAIFSNSEIGVSLSHFNTNNDIGYFGTPTNRTESEFDLNQAGAVFVFNNRNTDSDWKKFTVGLNIENSNSYYDRIFAAGINQVNSISNYFTNYANDFNIPLNLVELQGGETVSGLYQFLGQNEGFPAQQALLGYQAFILDPVDPDNPDGTGFRNNALFTNGVDQEYTKITQGSNRKLTLNVATQYKDNLYLGLNLNSHILEYRENTFISEIGFNADSPVQEIGFENELYTTGEGFSFQLGAIAKVSDEIRLGASYQSPTWYRIRDELAQGVFAYNLTDVTDPSSEVLDEVYPNVINLYEDYKLRTPAKVTGSFAYIFGKKGLISFDYSYKDFSNISLRPSRNFDGLNENIENNLRAASTYRVGGEYRIENWSLRGGYRFEQSPYENETTVGDLEGFSLGLGYNFGAMTVDLAYDRSEQDRLNQLYETGLTDSAGINAINSNITLSVNFKL